MTINFLGYFIMTKFPCFCSYQIISASLSYCWLIDWLFLVRLDEFHHIHFWIVTKFHCIHNISLSNDINFIYLDDFTILRLLFLCITLFEMCDNLLKCYTSNDCHSSNPSCPLKPWSFQNQLLDTSEEKTKSCLRHKPWTTYYPKHIKSISRLMCVKKLSIF